MRIRGFTLIELLVSLAVAAIILGIALPSYQAMVMNSKITAQRDGLGNALRYARSIALSQNVNTEVCPVGATNSTSCGNNWASGWMVVLNPQGLATTNPAIPTSLLQSTQLVVGGATISSVNAVNQVYFDPRGMSSTAAEFKICDSRGSAYAYSMQVQVTGSVEIDTTAGAAVWGGNITCP